MQIITDVFKEKDLFAETYDWCLRVEFQGRGTLHIHMCAWVRFPENCHNPITGKNSHEGRSGQSSSSPLLQLLEELFHGSVDIQCDNLGEQLLNYVTGYAAKAHDALEWKAREYGKDLGNHKWLMVYRLLTKRAPLVPEMFIDYAQVPLMIHTYQTAQLYAPVPHYVQVVAGERLIDGKKRLPANDHRLFYECFLQRRSQVGPVWASPAISFQEYARLVSYDAASKKVKSRYGGNRGRNSHKHSCAVGVHFSWELLDIYTGQFVAMFIPHDASHQQRNELCAAPRSVPDNTRFMAAALESGVAENGAVRKAIRKHAQEEPDAYGAWAAMDADETIRTDAGRLRHLAFEYLSLRMQADLRLRGRKEASIWTFQSRINAVRLLIDAHAGHLTVDAGGRRYRPRINADDWTLKRPNILPQRTWSPGQAELLELVRAGLTVDDANTMAASDVLDRFWKCSRR